MDAPERRTFSTAEALKEFEENVSRSLNANARSNYVRAGVNAWLALNTSAILITLWVVVYEMAYGVW